VRSDRAICQCKFCSYHDETGCTLRDTLMPSRVKGSAARARATYVSDRMRDLLECSPTVDELARAWLELQCGGRADGG
jgi:hypothetical protein